MNQDATIVITGLGLVTPIGIGKGLFWDALLAGRNGIRPISAFDTARYRTHRGGEVQDFDPARYCQRVPPKKIGRGAQLAVAASRLALTDAGVESATFTPARVAVVCGTTMGESPTAEAVDTAIVCGGDDGLEKIAPSFPFQFPSDMIPGSVARELELSGPVMTISTACAAGNYAIGYGADLLRFGSVDMVLAGGSDPLSRVVFTGFNSMLAVAPELCQPFDRNRKGMCVSEGAAMLVLERADSARRRGVEIYAEVTGYGLSNDAHHMTAPHPQGRGAYQAMIRAMEDSRISRDSIDYISAHGTGTPANDKIETLAIKRALGDGAYAIPVSSIKSMLGHTMGAAAAIEAAASALAIRHGVLPPTMHYEEPDPECDLDYVPNQPREKRIGTVLSNSFAFGGNCATLILSRYGA